MDKNKKYYSGASKTSFIALLIILLAVSIIILSVSILNLSRTMSEDKELASQKLQSKEQELTPELAPPKITPPKVLFSLSGSIKEIQSNAIILLANKTTFSGSAEDKDSNIETRKAIVNQDTEFSRLYIEIDDFSSKQTIQKQAIIFNDLRIGNNIEVIARSDITNKYEFEASQVRLLPILK